MTFKQLRIGDEFEFSSLYEFPYSGMERGPWVKLSPRMYERKRDGMTCQVGTIHVPVEREITLSRLSDLATV